MTRNGRPLAPHRGPRGATGTPARGVRKPRKVSRQGLDEGVSQDSDRGRGMASLTVKFVVLAVLVVLAVAVVLPSVRAYVRQQQQLEQLRAEVAQVEQEVTDLQAELARWDDNAYVIAQARERLSYVFPGERPFRVVDPEFVTGEAPVENSITRTTPDEQSEAWYVTVWDSLSGETLPDPGAP